MQHSRLWNLFGLLAVFVVTAGACNSPGTDPTSPTLPNTATGAASSAARVGPSGARFDGNVAVVDAAGQSFQLRDGTLIRVTAATQWKQSGPRVGSLAALADALASGQNVRAKGDGQADAGGAIVATRVDARSERGGGNGGGGGGGGGQPATRNLRGNATTADSLAGTMTLGTGLVVIVDHATSWKRGPQRLTSLEHLETALSAGATVYVKGKGTVADDSSVTATALDVRLRSNALGHFRGTVLAIDESGALVLADGTVIRPFDATRWKRGGRWLSSTDAIALALVAGKNVRAAGKGTLSADGSFLAAIIRAKVKPADDGVDDEESAARRR